MQGNSLCLSSVLIAHMADAACRVLGFFQVLGDSARYRNHRIPETPQVLIHGQCIVLIQDTLVNF